MKLSQQRKQGFTLIEIIIVVVILGILAAIALPKVTENINKAKAAEAFSFIGTVNTAFDRCVTDETGGGAVPTAGQAGNCITLSQLRIASTPANFTYTGAAINAPNFDFTMRYTGTGATANDTISAAVNYTTGAVNRVCGASGIFAKLCKN